MTYSLTIYSDYICPWCYVGQGPVVRLKTERALEVEWRPFYLYFDTPPEGRELPEYVVRARAAGSEERLKAIADSYSLPFISVPRIYNTRLAHEATEYARERGRANEFHRIVFRQVYGEGLDISQWSVLGAAAQEAGLDAEEMRRVVEEGAYAAVVEEQVRQAYQIGVTGVPTYVINERYAIVGAQPYEVFRDAFARLEAQPHQEGS
jgi:predicted DsbA family dithiol-disulfide isomerase